MEDEIDRLGKSTVNVCWYSEGRGVASGPGTMISAGRPLVLNDSPMFDHLEGLDVYRFPTSNGLGESIGEVLSEIREGVALEPYLAWEKLRWGTQVGIVIGEWEKVKVQV